MEIWIAKGNKKDLKKAFPFLRTYGIIDIKEIANLLGYETTIGLDDHSAYVINNEVKKRLESFNSSIRFYRVLLIVEEINKKLPKNLLDFSEENDFKYEIVYIKEDDDVEFRLAYKTY
jgi:hypothetical protein